MTKKTLNKELMEINNKIFAAKADNTLQFIYEKELAAALGLVFQKMKEEVLKNLEEYYSPEVMLKAHMDLILSPIHEYHRLYYETIEKYILREYKKGKSQGKRLVSNAKQYAKNYSRLTGAVKADTTKIPMSAIIKKDELFATSDYSAEHLTNKTFVASEKTLARVDKDINGIITEGYRDGKGINDVGNRIEKRFNQFKTWEANRIARTEIHGSHMQGVLQSYQDMDVQYIQWAAAHDSRVRDTHADLDGEIILMGSTFSNGLKYPGDTNGKLSEFINCRCGAIPWFCPPGYAVPSGMTRFRESDLVVTLDKWSNEELINQFNQNMKNNSIEFTPEQELSKEDLEYITGFRKKLKRYVERSNPVAHYDDYVRPQFLNSVEKELSGKNLSKKAKLQLESLKKEYPQYYEKLVDEVDNVNKVIDYNRLTPQEKQVYFRLKNNHDILKEAIENGDYSRLDDLEDLGGFFALRDRRSFMSYTENGKELDWAKDELSEIIEDMADYEKIIRDTNLYVDTDLRSINWKNPQLGNQYSSWNPKTKEYEQFNHGEKFIRYHFKKENLTIIESVDMDTSRVRGLYKAYKNLPKKLQNTNEIVLSSQDPRIKGILQDYKLGGYVCVGEGNRIVQFKKSLPESIKTLVHESAHNLEKDEYWYISSSKEYVRAFNKDRKRLLEMGYSLEETWVTPYSKDFTEQALKQKLSYHQGPYSEDFAESMKMYIHSPKDFEKMFPEKTKVIKKVLNGEFDKNYNISYKQWKDIELDKFALTEKERSKFVELKHKQIDLSMEGKPLKKSEAKELQFLEDKNAYNYARNQMVTGEANTFEQKKYLELHEKLKDKLNVNTIIKEVEEVPPRVKMRQEILASKPDSFALSSQEKALLKELESQESIGFLDKRTMLQLKEREYYNNLRNQVIDRSAMGDPSFDWDYLMELHVKFKDWKPLSSIKVNNVNLKIKSKSFKSPTGLQLSKKDKEIHSTLKLNKNILSPEQKKIYKELDDRVEFSKLHEKMLDENYFEHNLELQGLDINESQTYFELYKKYKSKWNLPDINTDDIIYLVTVNREDNFKYRLPDEYKRLDISALEVNESEELDKLFIKKYYLDGLTPKETKRLEFLKARRDFNEYYSVRVQNKGLEYSAEKDYHKNYKILSEHGFFDGWDVNDLIQLEKTPGEIYSPTIKWKEVKSSDYLKLKGCYADGLHPDISNLEDLFTIDTRKFSQFEKDMSFDWLGSDYKKYRTFLYECEGNVQKYAQWRLDNGLDSNMEVALNFSRETAYNSVKIINMLNNQLKKPTTLWRCETHFHLGENPKVGDIVTLEGINSTAITKEGMKYFEENSKKTITAYLEIEAPAGTRGAYMAPISPDKFKAEMEFLLQKDTKVEILKLGKKDGHDYAKLRILNKYDFDEVFNSRDINIKLS